MKCSGLRDAEKGRPDKETARRPDDENMRMTVSPLATVFYAATKS
ncbi:MAG TPA: hypothetical protein VHO70_23270 [Chitinispirillaceae bacterium]|nr:hypothetical protein [Chitinispirillaceae bacterium]